ncbi:MAG: hypothetical protein HKN43_00830 [Rhodothermales bacterium]|nr:hypothetical protein [Rhodothermales bacterium]
MPYTDLTSSTTTDWAAHAIADESIPADTDGEIFATIYDPTVLGMLSLVTSGDEPTGYATLDHAIYIYRKSDRINVVVYELGDSKYDHNSTAYNVYGEVVSVRRNGATGVIDYRLDGTTIYTSATTSTAELDICVSPFDNRYEMKQLAVEIDGGSKAPLTFTGYRVNVTDVAPDASYTLGATPIFNGVQSTTVSAWNGNCGSAEDMPASTDCKIRMRYRAESRMMFGLIDVDEDITSYTAINFAIYPVGSAGDIYVYEANSNKGLMSSTLADEDELEIRRDGTTGAVTYYQNDTLIYTSLSTSTAAHSVAASFYEARDAVWKAEYSVDGGDWNPLSWDYTDDAVLFTDRTWAVDQVASSTSKITIGDAFIIGADSLKITDSQLTITSG